MLISGERTEPFPELLLWLAGNGLRVSVYDERHIALHGSPCLLSGHVRCWGSNGRGELGSGIAQCNAPHGFAVPVEVQGLF
jgi:hypothetical protein